MNKHNLAFYGGEVSMETLKYQWPIIDDEIEKAVVEQLYESISIYNKSGIIERLENYICQVYGCKHALLTSSGTAALHSAYYAIGLNSKDEIICPNYTFFATCTPAFQLGGKIKLVDCMNNGSISFDEIKKAYTLQTKAIVITHMWGRPVDDYEQISQFCKERKLYLIEDCSHAHGAMINGKRVGTLGDISVFSLQGNKIITGGEGGVLITNNDDLYYRAIFFGHYNKRCRQEIPSYNGLSEFSVTGGGLKLRIHPIAARIAYEMYQRLDLIVDQRVMFWDILEKALENSRLVKVISNKNNMKHSGYAFTMIYTGDQNYGVDIDTFMKIMKAEGIKDIDLPGSTVSLSKFPLFYKSNMIYDKDFVTVEIISKTVSDFLSEKLLKLPCWQDYNIAYKYATVFDKIEDCLRS